MHPDRLAEIQSALQAQNLDAWLFFDHHQRDPLAYRILGFTPASHVTRRWYYLIPRQGEPHALVHRIEAGMLNALPGQKHVYAGWRSQQTELASLLSGLKTVAMQYSPGCAIPYVSMVDAGTVELIRSFGVDVVSSADLIQLFDATLDSGQIESHFWAAQKMDALRAAAFDEARNAVALGRTLTEYQLHVWLREAFDREGLTTDHGPIVAVNAHAGDPHYEPSAASSSEIRAGDLLLIDMWAKRKAPRSVYYDITWTAFLGAAPPTEIENVFSIVCAARDAGFSAVDQSRTARTPLAGFAVDNATRQVIEQAGYGQAFVHRTGHSIGEDVHGTGANMDDLETHDERLILPHTLFSIEPGIYLPHFGIRSEFNVLALPDSARTTGAIQTELLRLV
ncbi:MAG: M24 family metallopeptidase [Bryobacter sp.]|nr:M24 family metallopeptidase [Bryobacter sp.]